MKNRTWIVTFAALLLPVAVLAQDNPEPPAPLTDVWIMVPKPGMQDEFTAAAKKHIAFRAKAGESRAWLAFRPVIGDNLNVVQFRACCYDYADMDAFVVEGEKLSLGDNWNANVDQYVDHYHHYLERNDWDNSHWPEGSDGPYYGATSWVWKEGAGPEVDEIRKQISEMAKNGAWAEAGHNWLWLERIGGKPVTAVVTSFESYADMAPDEPDFFGFIAEQMGSAEKAGEMFAKFGAGFESSSYTVWVHDKELSTPTSD